MCGIFAVLNYGIVFDKKNTEKEFMKGQKRGPEFSKLDATFDNLALGFHRLAINGLNSASNQPLIIDDIVLICNGEIYNYEQLYKDMNITPKTNSDCEVIIHLYLRYGIQQTLLMLDGVYAFVLYDNSESKGRIYVARDPMGVRPLYETFHSRDETAIYSPIGFASELKCLTHLTGLTDSQIQHFTPGTYSSYLSVNSSVYFIENKTFYLPSFSYSKIINDRQNYYNHSIFVNIQSLLENAVVKRCITTERPVACLLSGGLDSSLIAALVANHFKTQDKQIETYSIGLLNSEDIKYARIVADYIGSKHTEIIVSEKDMFDAIPEVIQAIESYDTTTVRASIGNYLIGKYIATNSQAKVIFNGDGSDELFGGYLYMNKCPDDIEFDKETRRLLNDIHLFDVLRSDKSISSNGLEPRTPFLDRNFVNYVLSIPYYIRNHNNFNLPEKYLLRKSFDKTFFLDHENRQLLPDEILWRKKEAFSDGVSSQGRSLFTILQECISMRYTEQNSGLEMYKPSIDLEKKYYKEIFEAEFPDCSHIVPYFWMPKYTNATDPSARTLDVYND